MTESRKSIPVTIVAIILEYALLLGVNIFNQNILMSIPLAPRILVTFFTQWILMVVPLVFMKLSKETLKDYGFSKEKIGTQLLTGTVIGVAMSLIIVALPMILGHKDFFGTCYYSQTWQFFYEFFQKILAVALAEEFFYRGFLLKKLSDINSSKWFVVILSSLIFGFSHIFVGNIIQVIVTTILGMIWCICMVKIKNCTLLSLIVAHGLYDFFITLFLFII